MKARHMLAVAIAIVLARLVLRALGADAHASVISGMPISIASCVLGPLVVVTSLTTAILAPVLALAACARAALDRLNE